MCNYIFFDAHQANNNSYISIITYIIGVMDSGCALVDFLPCHPTDSKRGKP